jgi:deferrochelatase/peroxidase EfeB
MNTAGASGVSSIWSNCVGFPRTRLLFHDGAADRDRLVRWARRQQRPVPFWYSRYPRTTTDRVRTNAAIRQGLANASTAQDADDWLACFGSAPRPPTDLDFAEIPALAFGGFSRLPQSAVAAFRLSDSPDDCRAWLRTLQRGISYGEDGERSEACVVALSAAGMRKLGVGQDVLETFPVAFQQGMDAPERARANGDVGTAQQPADWEWGSGEKLADVYLVLYAIPGIDLEARLEELGQSAGAHGHQGFFALLLKDLPARGVFPVEAFGFVDGVSQPAIRGARRAAKPASDVLAPGEFILGYADQLGRYPSTPTIGAESDPERRLHEAGLDPDRQRPLFSQGDDAVRRDLGRNGTYLVVRHLEQHVKALQYWLHEEASRLGALDPWWNVNKLAAKLIGRWQNGTSLVRHPHGPGFLPVATKDDRPDNSFLYAKEDPTGAACPLGAHIRRANPRDGLAPGTNETHATVQTHRLLRVGRSYETPSAQGLMFMCIAADIERQFEFVQQRWLLNPSFSGLQEESDPLLGRCPSAGPGQLAGSGRAFSMPGPTGSYRARGLKDFVTVRGGGYFFVPSRAAFSVLIRS